MTGREALSEEEALAATSVIIPVKDDIKLAQCLESIDEDVEVVFALNGASDEVREIVKNCRHRHTVAEIPEANIGAAYNIGAQVASGRFLLFMDSDCTFRPGTIRLMAREVVEHPVVKGQCVFTDGKGWSSKVIRRAREFQTSDHSNAYSPPLIYDVRILPRIGGYHYSDLIHFQEDREFDFRLQLAGIPVRLRTEAVIHHAEQTGAADLRSGYRYGLGEAIGRELGLFVTPSPWWRLADDARSIAEVFRVKGAAPALYRVAWLGMYNLGTCVHTLFDPFKVRPRYPARARRIRNRGGVPVHSTKLDASYRDALRKSHERQGRRITPSDSV
ncbi:MULTISPECIES: glycosyltransferase [unclassified Streptomyces]|uniref:glycosyltransferase family 2 protein n=1 Tax=unclassified Streptomyces TaxID=2593676 RepID=UPI000998A27A|nr:MULTISPECIES: glycosyltransferase [unclassified Streptomyces]